MSLFNLPVLLKEKEVSRHPWQNKIKDNYANKIKHAHNSINNPVYPKETVKERLPKEDRVQFTIIGNRVTTEFIYCSNLVKGLHKYRWKCFDAPVIRAVTGVEWPDVWNALKIEFGGLAFCIDSQVAVLYNGKFLGGAKELLELVQTKYLYYLTPNYPKECVENFSTFVKLSGRPCVYLHISIADVHVGTMLFMLYSDIVPNTCENFMRLCKATKGGYSGTPIHRLVKDGWVQCGGFGLKSVDLECENFIVPHDRRGVLAMANDGRHVDCSTQFFILLQPAPWMTQKYVAFGQLIDGAGVLETIENVPTWYESPTKNIIIHHAGILNLECQDIMINRGAVEYIHGHIDDLVVIGEIFTELLMEMVWLEIEFRHLQNMEVSPEDIEGTKRQLGATQRFMRKKSEIEKQLEKSIVGDSRPSTALSKKSQENNDFDVDNYPYEEYSYRQATPSASVAKEEKPFYMALTDVPYPGETDSTYDLKKFLRGDYCLESDLCHKTKKNVAKEKKTSYLSDIFMIPDDASADQLLEDKDLDSDEEEEVKRYLKENVDRVSFAGSVVRTIAKAQLGMFNLFEKARKSELITDDELRRYRLLSTEAKQRELNRKVGISPDEKMKTPTKIKRRQTGFIKKPEQKKRDKQKTGSEYDEYEEEEEEEEEEEMEEEIEEEAPRPPPPKEEVTKTGPKLDTEKVKKVVEGDKISLGKGERDEARKPKKMGGLKFGDKEKTPEPPPMIFKPGTKPGDSKRKDDEDKNMEHGKLKPMRFQVPDEEEEEEVPVQQMKRRPTAFVRPGTYVDEDDEDEEDEDEEHKEASDTSVAPRFIIPEEDEEEEEAPVHQMKRRPTAFVRPGMFIDEDEDEDEEDEDEDEKQISESKTSVPRFIVPDEDEDDEEEVEAPTSFKRRPTAFVRPGMYIDEDEDEDEEDENQEQISESKTSVPRFIIPDEDEDDEDEEEVEPPTHMKRRPTAFVRPGTYVDEDEDEEDGDEEQKSESKTAVPRFIVSDEDEDEVEPPTTHMKRRPTAFVRPGTYVDEDEDEEDEDEEQKPESKTSVPRFVVPDEDEDEVEPPTTQMKRRPTAFVRPGMYVDEDEDEEEEDEEQKPESKTSVPRFEVPDDDEEEVEPPTTHMKRRPTAFVRPGTYVDEDDEDEDEDEKQSSKPTVPRFEVPDEEEIEQPSHFKRRPTAFVRPGMYVDDDDEDEEDEDGGPYGGDDSGQEVQKNRKALLQNIKVRIADDIPEGGTELSRTRRPTAYVPVGTFDDYGDTTRPSVLARLFDDFHHADREPLPTLKSYVPFSQLRTKNLLLTQSAKDFENEASSRYLAMRESFDEPESYDEILNIQHGAKLGRKISTDYFNTLGQMEKKHKSHQSIRTIEYAKSRPTLSVKEYQERNMRFLQENPSPYRPATKSSASCSKTSSKKIGRMPGD